MRNTLQVFNQCLLTCTYVVRFYYGNNIFSIFVIFLTDIYVKMCWPLCSCFFKGILHLCDYVVIFHFSSSGVATSVSELLYPCYSVTYFLLKEIMAFAVITI